MTAPQNTPARPLVALVRGRSRPRIWAAAAAVVLALGCLGAMRAMRDPAPADSRPAAPLWSAAPAGSAAPGAAASAPQASPTPVRTADDLKRVCDQRYFPKSPKVQSAGVQPVSVFSQDRVGQDRQVFDARRKRTLLDIPNWYTAPKRKAWDPESPAKVRLVACAELVGTGAQVKTCALDDPKGREVPMLAGKYRLTLYEVATGRKLLDERLTGGDQKCPFVVLSGADQAVHSPLSDRQLYDALKKDVER